MKRKRGIAVAGIWMAILVAGIAWADSQGIVAGSMNLGAVWFVGDSITQSNADADTAGSPRKSLYDLLLANGYTFTYTGHSTNNVDGLLATGTNVIDNLYYYHSGISGSMIGDDYPTDRVGMTANMATFWSTGRLALVKPDVILILLGTNDIQQGYDLTNAPSRLTILIQTIYALAGVGDPSIFLASIPPNRLNIPTTTDNVAAFNAAVPGVVAGFRAQGKKVYYVDLFTPLDNDFATYMRATNNLHPNAAGNGVMALQWFDAIEAVVNQPSLRTEGISDGAFHLEISGTTGETYQVEFSQSLTDTNGWQTATNIASLGSSSVLVSQSVTHTAGFYRVRWLQ
jgi:hypothetical protein